MYKLNYTVTTGGACRCCRETENKSRFCASIRYAIFWMLNQENNDDGVASFQSLEKVHYDERGRETYTNVSTDRRVRQLWASCQRIVTALRWLEDQVSVEQRAGEKGLKEALQEAETLARFAPDLSAEAIQRRRQDVDRAMNIAQIHLTHARFLVDVMDEVQHRYKLRNL